MIRNIIKSQSTKFLGSRTYHSVPPSKFKVENGLGSFMSSKTLQSVSQDWQQGLLDRLNDVVRGSYLFIDRGGALLTLYICRHRTCESFCCTNSY